MRAAVWAHRLGRGDAFAGAAFHAAFADGADLADPVVLARVAASAGLPAAELGPAVAAPEVKDELRARTDAAIALGVGGVPTVIVTERLFYGDDELEAAAAALAARR